MTIELFTYYLQTGKGYKQGLPDGDGHHGVSKFQQPYG